MPEMQNDVERPNPNGLRLWKVEIRYDFVVIAKDRAQATDRGDEYAEEALRDMGVWSAVDTVSPVRRVEDLDREWRDVTPYGEREENPSYRNCAEILSDPPEPTERELEAAGQARLFGA